MTLIVLVSPGNAPGVTTTGFALTLAWPQPILLAECSPAGGHLLAGYFGGTISTDRGLWHLALTTRQGVDAAIAQFPQQVLALDEHEQRLLLPGLRDPFRSTQLSDMWGHITEVFRHLRMDVIVDIGHVGADLPFELVRAADLVVMVMRPTLAQAAAAKPRLEALRAALGSVPVALCLVGDGAYDLRDIQRSLGDDFALAVRLPEDRRSAKVLSDGAPSPGGFGTKALMREASAVAKTLLRSAEAASPKPARAVSGSVGDVA